MSLLNNKADIIGVQDCLDAIDASLSSAKSYDINANMGKAIPITASGWSISSGNSPLFLNANLSTKIARMPLPDLKVGSVLSSIIAWGSLYRETGTTSITLQLMRVRLSDNYVNEAAVGSPLTISATTGTDGLALNSANAQISSLATTVLAGDSFYLKITGSSSSDGYIDMSSLSCTVEEA